MSQVRIKCDRCADVFKYDVTQGDYLQAENNRGFYFVRCPSCGYDIGEYAGRPSGGDSENSLGATSGRTKRRTASAGYRIVYMFGAVIYFFIKLTADMRYRLILFVAVAFFMLSFASILFLVPAFATTGALIFFYANDNPGQRSGTM